MDKAEGSGGDGGDGLKIYECRTCSNFFADRDADYERGVTECLNCDSTHAERITDIERLKKLKLACDSRSDAHEFSDAILLLAVERAGLPEAQWYEDERKKDGGWWYA